MLDLTMLAAAVGTGALVVLAVRQSVAFWRMGEEWGREATETERITEDVRLTLALADRE